MTEKILKLALSFFVLGVHEISYAIISHEIRLQVLYWLEAVSHTILTKVS